MGNLGTQIRAPGMHGSQDSRHAWITELQAGGGVGLLAWMNVPRKGAERESPAKGLGMEGHRGQPDMWVSRRRKTQ